MRRAWFPLLILTLISSLSLGCGQSGAGESASGSGSADSMLDLLPREAKGVFFVDIQKAITVPSAMDALAENQAKLDEFIAETGLDPSRDVISLAGAITSQAKGEDADGVMVMSVKVNQEALIAKIEEKKGELVHEKYEGVTIYTLPAEEGETEGRLAFLDDATAALGTPLEVRTVIDVHQGRAESVRKNRELMAVVERAERNTIFWAAFVFEEGEMTRLTEGNPMMSSLSGIQSVIMSFDYKDQMLLALLECESNSEEQNQQIADFLTGIKSFAAMGASEKPEMAELLRSIEISSTPTNVRVSASIPQDLLKRLEAAQKS